MLLPLSSNSTSQVSLILLPVEHPLIMLYLLSDMELMQSSERIIGSLRTHGVPDGVNQGISELKRTQLLVMVSVVSTE